MSPRESVLHQFLHQIKTTRPDLAVVLESWDKLPTTIRQAILAMVKAGLNPA